MNDFFAAVELMMTHEASTGAVGITGFVMAAVSPMPQPLPTLSRKAAVPFYGRQADAVDAPNQLP